MSKANIMKSNIEIYHGDISDDFYDHLLRANAVGWDIETTGLDWKCDHIGTCQLCTDKKTAIVRCGKSAPEKLKILLSEPSVKKVFHHAMFDLRFMCYHWKTRSMNVACTKIASKLLDKDLQGKHSLQVLLKKHLDISINKREQKSNWLAENLTDEQISYAVRDAQYLVRLLGSLEGKLEVQGDLELARDCYEHIPTRVQLDILEYPDVFSY